MSRIKEFRENYGLTQQEVANIIGCSKRAVEGWEQGSRKPKEWLENLILEKLYREHFDWITKNSK